MTDIAQTIPSTPRKGLALTIFAAIGVLWYLFGFAQFVIGVTTDTAAAVAAGAMSPAHAAAVDATPALIWIAFALPRAPALWGLLR